MVRVIFPGNIDLSRRILYSMGNSQTFPKGKARALL
jgi:hypothetical protein